MSVSTSQIQSSKEVANANSGKEIDNDLSIKGSNPESGEDEDANVNAVALDETAQEEAMEKLRREREARAQALTLEIVGDLPYAEVKPPENVLFVCKLNPVTEGQAIRSSRFNNYNRTHPSQQMKI